MKNLCLLISFLPIVLTSCSNDSESDQNAIVPSTVSKLVTTSNTANKVSYSNLLKMDASQSFSVNGVDADGAYFNNATDELIIASRTNNRLELYTGLNKSVSNSSDNLTLKHFTNSDFNNPREIAVVDDKVIVTQDQNAANGNVNKLLVYQKTSSGFNLLKSYIVNFKIWGIHMEGSTLYAVADLTSDLVVFNDFFSNVNGAIMPTKRVSIAGLVRTHGITFSNSKNIMLLTDVGSATSDSDGGIIVINNFSSVLNATANLGTIALSSQIRIYGPNSKLGNPVDIAYDKKSNAIYVAERLNMGGQVLTFGFPTTTGDASPTNSRMEAGVSSVFLAKE